MDSEIKLNDPHPDDEEVNGEIMDVPHDHIEYEEPAYVLEDTDNIQPDSQDDDGYKESNLVRHAREELQRAGLFDRDSDYEGMTGWAVLDLIQVFSKQGHSGFSAMMVRDLFHKLSAYETLTPITDDPDEWIDRTEDLKIPLYQSSRNPKIFSRNGGKTYYDIDFESKGRRYWPSKKAEK